ncbi:DinB family protein [Amycolatopsis sp. H20-H5]|uniref:DinB family protein n=1 Tax=Amycolatopsis sp. H20-H5 TaxID=3046309 RepID=UPI002DB60E9E|nr:DinB family protein [Amycolatopsis sp. H20-H5]MEC3977677.1 DinB family protein [Amycolatopsis sp. H20-H5]
MATSATTSAAPQRPEAPLTGDERTQLNGFLDYLRATVVWKSSGLTDEQASRSLVPSKLTTIAGLVQHLTYVEQYWFSVVFDGIEDPWKEVLKTDPDAEFRVAADSSIEQIIADYQAECQRSREVAAKRDLADEVPFRDKGTVNLRFVLAHLVEETGRHAGHLDLLRELIDGVTGE